MALGVYITYRILNFADLTVDGSFPLGGAVAATVIANGGSPLWGTCLAAFAGMLAGLATGFLNTKLKISGLLSGILTMTALYSVNLRIMEGLISPTKKTYFGELVLVIDWLLGLVCYGADAGKNLPGCFPQNGTGLRLKGNGRQ